MHLARGLAVRRRRRFCLAVVLAVVSTLVNRYLMWVPSGGSVRFHATQAVLQLCGVQEPATTYPASQLDALPSIVKPLGLLGHTIGGSFFVDWDESPWGPYREVGLLSSLVSAKGTLAWGGWASHVWVDSLDAAEAGRRIWGLPVRFCDMEVLEPDSTSVTLAFVRSSNGNQDHMRIRIRPPHKQTTDTQGLVLPWPLPTAMSLPSLSGCLPNDLLDSKPSRDGLAAAADPRNLLSYNLMLRSRDIQLLPGEQPAGAANAGLCVDFSSWFPLFGVALREVEINVGLPEELWIDETRA